MNQMEIALPPGASGALIERVAGKVKSLSENIPLLVGMSGDVMGDTKRLQVDIQAYKQSIESENMQAEHEVARARAEHVMESSETLHEIKDNVQSTTRVTKTRKVVQTVTATKTRIIGVGPITDDMVLSIDDMFSKLPLLDNKMISWSMERGGDGPNAITITSSVMRAGALESRAEGGARPESSAGRALIFIPKEAIPYRQMTEETEAETETSKKSGMKADDFVLEIKRKEGLRTLWQETAPIKLHRIADRLSRLEVELQENMFELLTSEASYGYSLSVVLKHLFNVDCVQSSQVVVHSENDCSGSKHGAANGLANVTSAGATTVANAGKTPASEIGAVAIEFEKLVKPLDRKALQLNLDELHRNSVSLLDSLKKCWIADSCLMKGAFVQILAERLADTSYRASYLAYLRDVRYQQELLRELLSCRRVSELCSPAGLPEQVGASGADTEEHLCMAERYTRAELERLRSLLAEFHTLKCVENRALQSFLLLPLERLTKLKMCLESCEKLARKLLHQSDAAHGNSNASVNVNLNPAACSLVQLGLDLNETSRVLHTCLQSCCSLLDESNRMTYTCMQAEAQLQLDRLVRFQPTFGVQRISLVRTDRLFLKDDSCTLLRLSETRSGVRAESLKVRLFLFSDLLLLTADARKQDEAFAHFGLASSASKDGKAGGSFIGRLRKSVSRKHTAAHKAHGPAAGKFACGTADLAHAIAGSGSLIVLDYAFLSAASVKVALLDTRCPNESTVFPPTQTVARSRMDSKRLHRSQSTVPASAKLSVPKQRRISSLVPSESDTVVCTYCQQLAKESANVQLQNGAPHDSLTYLLRLTLTENGCGERAEYVFRCANESDAPRWFDALAMAISNKQEDKSQQLMVQEADSVSKQSSFTVLRPHSASYGEELELAKGDCVTVLKRTADGWCKGALQNGSRSGWFRSTCIE